jgi:hypothetical protein
MEKSRVRGAPSPPAPLPQYWGQGVPTTWFWCGFTVADDDLELPLPPVLGERGRGRGGYC